MSQHFNLLRPDPVRPRESDKVEFLRALAAQLEQLADECEAAGGTEMPKDNLQLAAFAEALIKSRQRRSHWIAGSLLGEPAWDLLLQLFVNATLGRRQTAAELASQLHVEPTMVLRWVQVLIERGLASCIVEDRRTIIELVGSTRSAMADMLNEWRELGKIFAR